jgi:hypothetical protein
VSAKDFFERSDGELRKGMKHSVTGEKAIGNEGMDVRVKIEVFAKSVEGQDDCGMRLFIPERGRLLHNAFALAWCQRPSVDPYGARAAANSHSGTFVNKPRVR